MIPRGPTIGDPHSPFYTQADSVTRNIPGSDMAVDILQLCGAQAQCFSVQLGFQAVPRQPQASLSWVRVSVGMSVSCYIKTQDFCTGDQIFHQAS